MTLYLAGHETTALTLSWSWYLISRTNMKVATVYVVRGKVQKLLQAEIELLETASHLA